MYPFSNKSANIYEDALAIIEKEYNCGRIKSLHKFIIKIENYGGNYETYIDILLEDIKTFRLVLSTFLINVKVLSLQFFISIASTLITCGFMAYLIPKDYKFTEHGLYQVCSMILIMAMIFTYLAITKRLNFDWLKEERALPDNMVIKYYALVEKGYNNISYGSIPTGYRSKSINNFLTGRFNINGVSSYDPSIADLPVSF